MAFLDAANGQDAETETDREEVITLNAA